jgi:6-phosphogluconolactonase
VDIQNRLLLFNDKNEMADFMLGRWKELLRAYAGKPGEVFTAAFSGGRTPVDFYRKLSGLTGVPWERVHLFLVDERFVPLDDPQSNYGMLNDVLLRKIPLPAGNMHYVRISEVSSVEAVAGQYERDLQEFFSLGEGEFPSFDLILLGIGEDGHTASLLPGVHPGPGGKKAAGRGFNPAGAGHKQGDSDAPRP